MPGKNSAVGIDLKSTVEVRPALERDAPECGRIMYEAFGTIADAHGVVPDFPSAEIALRVARSYVADPSIYGIVAEIDGAVVGSNFLLERDPIRTIGPTSVDPRCEGRGIGRALTEAILERAEGAVGVRLVQDASNMRSLALYAILGFSVKEPLLLLSGRTSGAAPPLCEVRPMDDDDLAACNALCRKVHGFERGNELREALMVHEPFVLVRNARITGYLSAANSWLVNHGVAESDGDLRALLTGVCAQRDEELAFYLPSRDSRLLGWALTNGFRALKTATLMARGSYDAPRGAFLASAHY